MTTSALRTIAARGRAHRGRGMLRRTLLVLALPILLIGLWWFGSANSTNYLNPPLATIVSEFWPTWFGGDSLGQSRFVQDVIPSFLRIVAGYAIALVIGIAVGVLIGASKRLRSTLEPVIEFFRSIPPPVLVPIFMLFMGIGDGMKIAVIALGCVWPILLNTVEGVRGLDPVLRDTARSYRFTPVGTLRRLILPGASPHIVTGARQALSIGIILMVISEMFAAQDGLGFSIVQFQRSFAIPQMWGGVILLGVLGVAFALVFRVVSGAILKWYYGYLHTQRGGA
ncbi:ABC transporter permease [Leucobacter sp. M11]|uniref:ABC transporter permease n=1 Tax=Leucobacter sp. M11 TaxID=2993565 RepID=UPI002D7EB3F0|nr:ABC transporter permease [Leucobacter sp. M11]MEB4613831.1 ABC transporter permease [Leucobacter sp. M11]